MAFRLFHSVYTFTKLCKRFTLTYMYYSITFSVPSVCTCISASVILRPCNHDKDKTFTIVCIFIKLGRHVFFDEQLNSINFLGQRSKIEWQWTNFEKWLKYFLHRTVECRRNNKASLFTFFLALWPLSVKVWW